LTDIFIPHTVMQNTAMSWKCVPHKPAASWVNTTRYCKYRQVLLMMGENIARNM